MMESEARKVEKALYRALHSFAGAADRWEEWRQRGLTDAELLEGIGFEFGTMGGCSGPDGIRFAYRGGSSPKFWSGTCVSIGRPTLQGRKLVEMARQVLKIPQPTEVLSSGGQLLLAFGE